MAALNAEIPDELKRSLDLAVAQRDVTLKAAISDAIKAWLGHEKEEPDDPVISQLREFLGIGEPEDVRALKVNVEVFWRDAKRRSKRRPA